MRVQTASMHRGVRQCTRSARSDPRSCAVRRRSGHRTTRCLRNVRTSSAAAAGDEWFSLDEYEKKHGSGRTDTAEANAKEKPVVDVDIDVRSATSTELVSALLSIVGTTSDGSNDASLTAKQIDIVVEILDRLEEIGSSAEPRPLSDPRIYGNYNVSYTLMGNRQYGQPAGGRFRTGLGALLFKTRGLYQSVLEPDVVVNKVVLDILRILPAYVGLRGKLVQVPEEDGTMAGDTVKVFFDPPVLGFPYGIVARIGPPSTVVLKTTYVDERVRIGKGSRGSLFVFTRGGDSDGARMETVGLERTSGLGKAIIALGTLGMVGAGGWVCYAGFLSKRPVISAFGWILAMLGLFLANIFVRGGIFNDSEDRPDVTLDVTLDAGRPTAKEWRSK